MSNTKEDIAEIDRVFQLHCKSHWEIGQTTAKHRRKKLKLLEKALFRHRDAIRSAMAKDFSKPAMDVDLSEIFVVLKEIRHARRNLSRWMSPTYVPTPVSLIGTKSKILFEPKGKVLIISPWNFPINLTFGPLVGAISAGNTVILKPSELTPHSTEIMKIIVGEVFEPHEVFLFAGSENIAQKLTSLPFDHIFFTGGPGTGKKVRIAAAENNCSLTLELGGKSPAIVDESADLKNAAKRIAWGKFLNAGQLCIAPDHVFIHEDVTDRFVELLKEETCKLFGEDIKLSKDFSRLVSEGHFNRMEELVADATCKGAQVFSNAEPDSAERFFPPTFVENPAPDSRIMQEEIFGPILPIISYQNLSEVNEQINQRGKPLALYIFTSKKSTVEKVISETRAGTTAVNECLLQFFHPELPFGGSNLSGSGKAHGHFSFQEFSNQRSLLKQSFKWNTFLFAAPPYTRFKQKLVDLIIRWL